jgi:hypothetical protein
MTALKEIKAGEPLYVNYGFTDNLHSMLNYGFVLTDPYFDKLMLTATRAAVQGGTESQTAVSIVESEEGLNTLMTLLLNAALDTRPNMSFDFAAISCSHTGMELWAELQRAGVSCLQSTYGCSRAGFGVICPRHCLQSVQRGSNMVLAGTGEYTMQSSICLAAIHHTYLDGGEFVFTPMRATNTNFIASVGGGGLTSSPQSSTGTNPGFTVGAPFNLIPRNADELRYSSGAFKELADKNKSRTTKSTVKQLLAASQRMHGAGGQFTCSVFNAGWWTFRWCHQSEVRQYHKDVSTGMITDDWSLGRYDKTLPHNATSFDVQQVRAYTALMYTVLTSCVQQRIAEVSRVGVVAPGANDAPVVEVIQLTQGAEEKEEEVGHYAQYFTGGQKCDDSGHGRAVEVRFACCNATNQGVPKPSPMNMEIGKVYEPRPCFYELTVCVPLLCSNRAPVELSHFPPCGDCEKRFKRSNITREERNKRCATAGMCTPEDYEALEKRRKEALDVKAKEEEEKEKKEKKEEKEEKEEQKTKPEETAHPGGVGGVGSEVADTRLMCSFQTLEDTWTEAGSITDKREWHFAREMG